MIKWLNQKDIDWDRVKELLEMSALKNWYTNFGPVSSLLEERIYSNLEIDSTKAVIAISNGSHALHAVVAAIELVDGPKEYTVPAYTFPTNVQGTLKGSRIVDINEDFGLSLVSINDSSKIDGIIVTNIFGYSQDISKYVKWADSMHKTLIFDNASTPFTKYNGKNSLNYGTASIISFHHTKPLGFGEGGAIIIDKKYESAVRQIINFGFDENREYNPIGNNWKMSDVAAAFILQHLDDYDKIRNHHIKLYKHFLKETKNISGIKPFPNYADVSESFISGLAVVFDKPVTVDLAKSLCNNEIDVNKYYSPLGAIENYPNAHDLYNRTLIYPCHINMNETDVSIIVENIKYICNEQ